ncbi:YbcC family protein [Limnobacter sp.]|uniref:YbcC family protein n=1 Tax=Limnobacter sp. TaxID=2003368 RepID=UPI003516F0AE
MSKPLNSIDQACEQACNAIAPAWPLDQSIAVNPHWCRTHLPLRSVAARMAVLGGIQVFPPRALVKQAWQEGRLTKAHVDAALQSNGAAVEAGLQIAQCMASLDQPAPVYQLPLLIDLLDNDPLRHTRLSWREAITHQVSQTCAAYFDQHQADWQPERTEGLYAFWRDTLAHDHGIGLLMGLPQLGKAIDALPASAKDAEQWALHKLDFPADVWADYLESVLLTVQGWASWCAYLGWQARLAGGSDPHLRELLAIRLAWGALLLECKDDEAAQHAFAAVKKAWRDVRLTIAEVELAMLVDEVWQCALEQGFQSDLKQQLTDGLKHTPSPGAVPYAQAAFCIDVRSERLRRALEHTDASIQTLGFAGFFGLPVAYTPLGTQARRPQLPGLLAPAMEVSDRLVPVGGGHATTNPALDAMASVARNTRLGLMDHWKAASRWPGTAFSFVESAGMGYLGKLGQWLKPGQHDRERDDLYGMPTRYRPMCRPQLLGLQTSDKVALAAKVLGAMGLRSGFAPLVVLVGHGSQSANNPHAAALDCGACCGQTGEVNARSLALLLNDTEVRQGLLAHHIQIPDSTRFVAALHNTTTDEVEGFDIDLLPSNAQTAWTTLQKQFDKAAEQVRQERAPALRIKADTTAEQLLQKLRRRANDGAQTRPEWGLANNAGFLIAPRHRSLGLNLDGRCFLHDYNPEQDPTGEVLELLMTAPMLVTHWINWQYHASTCDPQHLGSGNKLLHNVVGGHLGVFEGNGGDLRIGLARQSVHDGERWVHEPLRLTVVIEATQAAIDRVISKHAVVKNLLDNGWLHLWRLSDDGLYQYQQGLWHDGSVSTMATLAVN